MSKTYRVILKDEELFITAPDDEAAAYAALSLSEHLEQDLIDVIPMKRKKYFPNNWKQYKDLDERHIIKHKFEDVMACKEVGVLDDTHYALIRTRDIFTGKVKERAYKSKRYALAALTNAVLSMNYEVIFLKDEVAELFDPRIDVANLNEFLWLPCWELFSI